MFGDNMFDSKTLGDNEIPLMQDVCFPFKKNAVSMLPGNNIDWLTIIGIQESEFAQL